MGKGSRFPGCPYEYLVRSAIRCNYEPNPHFREWGSMTLINLRQQPVKRVYGEFHLDIFHVILYNIMN